MDTKLVAIFILSGILGAIIVITGCIKVLGKNGELNLKTAGFILAGFIFVALPVLGTVSFEWGEFKLLINTTNKQVYELQQTLDSLKTANMELQKELDSLQVLYNRYRNAVTGLHAEPLRRIELARQIDEKFVNIQSRVANVRSSLDSASSKNIKVRNDIRKFENKKWFINP